MFVGAVLAISWSFEGFIIAHGGVRNFGPLWIVLLMWIPGAVAIALRILSGCGFADAGFRIGKARHFLLALLIPVVLALLAGLVAVALDLRRLSPVSQEQLGGLAPVLLSVLVLGLIGAIGEEIGWRGFLLPKMEAGGFRNPWLLSGLVWAAWHVPLIAFGGFYEASNALPMAAVYVFGILAMSFVFSELRMRSGSVWVPSLAHAAHNFIFQFTVPALVLTVPGARAGLWDLLAGDTGLCIALLYAAAYGALRRR